MTEKPLELMGLRDLRKIMRQKAPAEAWQHFNGAAESKATFRRNPQAFSQYLFDKRFFTTFPSPILSSSYSARRCRFRRLQRLLEASA